MFFSHKIELKKDAALTLLEKSKFFSLRNANMLELNKSTASNNFSKNVRPPIEAFYLFFSFFLKNPRLRLILK